MTLRRALALVCAVLGLGALVIGGWSAAQFRVVTSDAALADGKPLPRPSPLAWLGPQPFVPLIALLLAAPAGFVGFVALARRRPGEPGA